MGCVYLAKNKNNGKVYIGKTVKPLNCRISQHKNSAEKGMQTLFARAIRKWGFDSFVWSVLFESDDDSLLCRKEIEYIASYGSHRPSGYNITFGGEGVSHDAALREQKRVLALKQHSDPDMRKRWEEGIKHADRSRALLRRSELLKDPEYRKRLSASLKSKITDEQRARASARMKERMEIKYGGARGHAIRKRTQQVYRSLVVARMTAQMIERNKVKVLCVELEKTFSCVKEAGKLLGIERRLISAILAGRQHTAGGFHFRRVSNDTSR